MNNKAIIILPSGKQIITDKFIVADHASGEVHIQGKGIDVFELLALVSAEAVEAFQKNNQDFSPADCAASAADKAMSAHMIGISSRLEKHDAKERFMGIQRSRITKNVARKEGTM